MSIGKILPAIKAFPDVGDVVDACRMRCISTNPRHDVLSPTKRGVKNTLCLPASS
jgi:hypothetical protein